MRTVFWLKVFRKAEKIQLDFLEIEYFLKKVRSVEKLQKLRYKTLRNSNHFRQVKKLMNTFMCVLL